MSTKKNGLLSPQVSLVIPKNQGTPQPKPVDTTTTPRTDLCNESSNVDNITTTTPTNTVTANDADTYKTPMLALCEETKSENTTLAAETIVDSANQISMQKQTVQND